MGLPSRTNDGIIFKSLQIPHMYCTDHVIQLTAKKAFNKKHYRVENEDVLVFNSNHDLPNNSNNDFCLMKKYRKLVEVFTLSTQKMEQLLNTQKSMDIYIEKIPVKVGIDVVTSWWSTFSML